MSSVDRGEGQAGPSGMCPWCGSHLPGCRCVKARRVTMLYREKLPVIRAVANSYGYAVGVHGSMERDLDLIACPWTDEAVAPEALAEVIVLAVGGVVRNNPVADAHDYTQRNPQPKPHGRLAWAIQIGGGAYVDLSVMSPFSAALRASEVIALQAGKDAKAANDAYFRLLDQLRASEAALADLHNVAADRTREILRLMDALATMTKEREEARENLNAAIHRANLAEVRFDKLNAGGHGERLMEAARAEATKAEPHDIAVAAVGWFGRAFPDTDMDPGPAVGDLSVDPAFLAAIRAPQPPEPETLQVTPGSQSDLVALLKSGKRVDALDHLLEEGPSSPPPPSEEPLSDCLGCGIRMDGHHARCLDCGGDGLPRKPRKPVPAPEPTREEPRLNPCDKENCSECDGQS